jgi:hypothetical protein
LHDSDDNERSVTGRFIALVLWDLETDFPVDDHPASAQERSPDRLDERFGLLASVEVVAQEDR